MAVRYDPEFPVLVTTVLQDARIKDDNWTGKTDPLERKRRQNRLHQRAWRRRKAQEHASATQPSLGLACQRDINNPPLPPLTSRDVVLRQLVQDHVSGRQRLPISFEVPESRDAFWAALETLGQPQSMFAYLAELRAQRKYEFAAALISNHSSLALQLHSGDTLYNTRHSTFQFPLGVDHQLFVLIQHNALRGVMINMSILLHLKGRPVEGWADFYIEDLPIPDNAPPSLQPTPLQKAISHESWIDVLPYARMRDNIINSQDSIDADALCEDFLGGFNDGLSEVESRGMILWGEPWSEDGWEISEGFARKWAFLMVGCEELISSTNRWREARGEERLIVEV